MVGKLTGGDYLQARFIAMNESHSLGMQICAHVWGPILMPAVRTYEAAKDVFFALTELLGAYGLRLVNHFCKSFNYKKFYNPYSHVKAVKYIREAIRHAADVPASFANNLLNPSWNENRVKAAALRMSLDKRDSLDSTPDDLSHRSPKLTRELCNLIIRALDEAINDDPIQVEPKLSAVKKGMPDFPIYQSPKLTRDLCDQIKRKLEEALKESGAIQDELTLEREIRKGLENLMKCVDLPEEIKDTEQFKALSKWREIREKFFGQSIHDVAVETVDSSDLMTPTIRDCVERIGARSSGRTDTFTPYSPYSTPGLGRTSVNLDSPQTSDRSLLKHVLTRGGRPIEVPDDADDDAFLGSESSSSSTS